MLRILLSLFLLLFGESRLWAAAQAKTYLIDSLEQSMRWEVKEWGDSANLEIVPESATDGQKSLRVSFNNEGRQSQKKIVLRRPIQGLAEEMKTIELDLFNPFPQKHIELALAVEADQYYETEKVSLHQGWNRKLKFAIDHKGKLKSTASNWEFTAQIPPKAKVGSLILLLYTDGVQTGSFHVDNFRSQGPQQPLQTLRQKAKITSKPVLRSVTILSTPQRAYEPLELAIDLDARYFDPYAGEEIAVEADFLSPSGKRSHVRGFLYKGLVTLSTQVEKPEWRLRFTPNEAGQWAYQLSVKNPLGSVTAPAQTFRVEAPVSDGFVRVDPKDPTYFSFDSGRFYYPIGQNTAWDRDENYRKMFAAMKEHGETWARIWMSHWSFGIEWRDMGRYKGLGNYNLENAERLDKILKLAEEYGIYVQLVFEFHGALSSKVNPEWPNNPYNKEQGGMLRKAADFFTDAQAKELYKRRLSYILARWGHSSHIMAWEFFNEINFSDDFNPQHEARWLKEMSQWLKASDPYQHLITTSYYDSYNKDSYKLATIDYMQYHAYQRNVWKTMEQVVPRFASFQKPFFFGEFGADSADGVDAQDKKGVFLHAGLWVHAMQPLGGNAMPWWWDSHIAPNQLYYHFEALARFLKDYDRRGKHLETLRENWTVKMAQHTEDLTLYGLKGKDQIMGWIADRKGMHSQDRPTAQNFHGIQFYVRDIPEGRYEVEYWDTYQGKIISTEALQVKNDGKALLTLPSFTNDIAFKIKAL